MVESSHYFCDIRDVRVREEVVVGFRGEIATVGDIRFDLAIFYGAGLDGEKESELSYLGVVAVNFSFLGKDILEEDVTFGSVLVVSRESGDAVIAEGTKDIKTAKRVFENVCILPKGDSRDAVREAAGLRIEACNSLQRWVD